MTANDIEDWNSGPYAEAIHAGRGDLSLRDGEGWCFPLDLKRWCARADAGDRAVLRRCTGRVLDIGCGAGRLVEALVRRGHSALGIDICSSAVITTMNRGGAALHRSVFDPLPHEGRWDTALLIDGNIGIGGDPRRLLHRVRDLVRPQGFLLVETAPVDVDECRHVRIHAGHEPVGASFRWAAVGASALGRHARASGWTEVEQWSAAGGRHFVSLRARS